MSTSGGLQFFTHDDRAVAALLQSSYMPPNTLSECKHTKEVVPTSKSKIFPIILENFAAKNYPAPMANDTSIALLQYAEMTSDEPLHKQASLD